MKKCCAAAVREEQPMPEQGQICEGLSSVRGTHVGAGEECEKEEAAETKSYGLIIIPIPPPLVLLRGRR